QGVDGDQEGANQQTQIDEIIVTANKRAEGTSLQDTAASISVLSSETIDNRGLVSASDYLATIPGASFSEFGATEKKIIIRGLSIGNVFASSPVGNYLGEIPLGAGVFDVKLVDIERVEVLKGPQGTLYGSDAFAGVVRNIPLAPNLQEMEGSVKVNASSQSESDNLNNSIVGVLNIPLVADKLALRVAAYRFDNAGYVDAVSTPLAESIAAATGSAVIIEDDLGGSTYSGARTMLLWNASENLSTTLTFGTQEIDVKGSPEVPIGSNDYKTNYLNTPHGKNETVDFDYSNLLIEYDLGWASLMSASSLLKGDSVLAYNNLTRAPGIGFGLEATSSEISVDREHVVEEIRLASQLEGSWQFVFGLFYEDLKTNTYTQLIWDGSPSANPFGPDPVLQNTSELLELTQKALFSELTYSFSEQWDLTLGARYFDYDREDTTRNISGAFTPPGLPNSVDASETGTTYKANLSFTPNDDTLIYAQWSEGFRLGQGQNLPLASLCDTDGNGKLDFTDGDLVDQVAPDTTENFELGAKFTLLDSRLTLNTAIFNIDWQDLPALIIDTSSICPADQGVLNNIGEANSKGIEMEAIYLVTPQLAINLSASYIEAEWEETEGITAKSGEYLTFAPRTNANLGVQYDFDLSGFSAFARTDISYVGEYETAFQSDRFLDFRYDAAGDYVNINFRLGINVDQWALAFYAANLTNEGSIINRFPRSEYGLTPRKLGLEASYHF
ncbi:TonB-dependent receptor, partial [Porticoccaceae bacterium]|nr:TonB-dependent receptor [Porticoccaceae bacterium]